MTLLLVLGISTVALLVTNAVIINEPIPVPVKVRRK